MHLLAALQGRCILQSEGNRAMPVLMRSCVHAEMRIGARGRAECRSLCVNCSAGRDEGTCSGGSGTGAQPPRAIERCWRQLPASAAVISRWMWRLENVSFLLYRRFFFFKRLFCSPQRRRV